MNEDVLHFKHTTRHSTMINCIDATMISSPLDTFMKGLLQDRIKGNKACSLTEDNHRAQLDQVTPSHPILNKFHQSDSVLDYRRSCQPSHDTSPRTDRKSQHNSSETRWDSNSISPVQLPPPKPTSASQFLDLPKRLPLHTDSFQITRKRQNSDRKSSKRESLCSVPKDVPLRLAARADETGVQRSTSSMSFEQTKAKDTAVLRRQTRSAYGRSNGIASLVSPTKLCSGDRKRDLKLTRSTRVARRLNGGRPVSPKMDEENQAMKCLDKKIQDALIAFNTSKLVSSTMPRRHSQRSIPNGGMTRADLGREIKLELSKRRGQAQRLRAKEDRPPTRPLRCLDLSRAPSVCMNESPIDCMSPEKLHGEKIRSTLGNAYSTREDQSLKSPSANAVQLFEKPPLYHKQSSDGSMNAPSAKTA